MRAHLSKFQNSKIAMASIPTSSSLDPSVFHGGAEPKRLGRKTRCGVVRPAIAGREFQSNDFGTVSIVGAACQSYRASIAWPRFDIAKSGNIRGITELSSKGRWQRQNIRIRTVLRRGMTTNDKQRYEDR